MEAQYCLTAIPKKKDGTEFTITDPEACIAWEHEILRAVTENMINIGLLNPADRTEDFLSKCAELYLAEDAEKRLSESALHERKCDSQYDVDRWLHFLMSFPGIEHMHKAARLLIHLTPVIANLMRYKDIVEETDMLLMFVQNHPQAMKYIPTDKVTNTLCLLSVTAFPLSLEYVPITWKTQKLCEVAVCQDGRAIEFVPKELIDLDICIDAILQEGCKDEHKPALNEIIPKLPIINAAIWSAVLMNSPAESSLENMMDVMVRRQTGLKYERLRQIRKALLHYCRKETEESYYLELVPITASLGSASYSNIGTNIKQDELLMHKEYPMYDILTYRKKDGALIDQYFVHASDHDIRDAFRYAKGLAALCPMRGTEFYEAMMFLDATLKVKYRHASPIKDELMCETTWFEEGIHFSVKKNLWNLTAQLSVLNMHDPKLRIYPSPIGIIRANEDTWDKYTSLFMEDHRARIVRTKPSDHAYPEIYLFERKTGESRFSLTLLAFVKFPGAKQTSIVQQFLNIRYDRAGASRSPMMEDTYWAESIVEAIMHIACLQDALSRFGDCLVDREDKKTSRTYSLWMPGIFLPAKTPLYLGSKAKPTFETIEYSPIAYAARLNAGAPHEITENLKNTFDQYLDAIGMYEA